MTHQTQPEYISKEQFRKECHVSKATALKLIQSGLLPAIDTHKATKRYLIARKDIEKYLLDREKNPEKFGYKNQRRVMRYDYCMEYSARGAARLHKTVQRLWADKPDLLTVREAVKLLGYNRSTICNWQKKFEISGIRTQKGFHFSKKHLMDFIASPEFHAVKLKSPEHIDLLRRANYE